MKIEIEDLVIETTRRCNMACPHCLRGPAQDTDMPAKYLHDLLRNTSLVETVTFSGGEPSLAIPVMKRFYEIARQHGTQVNSFFIATNGKANQAKLALFALEQYAKAEDTDACQIALSVDPYHEPGCDELVRGLAFYSDAKERRPDQLDWELMAGNAEANGIGRPRPTCTEFQVSDLQSDGTLRTETVYLSCNGFAYPECDLSYDELDAAKDDPGSCPTESVPARLLPAFLADKSLTT